MSAFLGAAKPESHLGHPPPSVEHLRRGLPRPRGRVRFSCPDRPEERAIVEHIKENATLRGLTEHQARWNEAVVPLSMDQIRHCCAECHRAEKQPNEPWVRWFQGLTGLKYLQGHRQYICTAKMSEKTFMVHFQQQEPILQQGSKSNRQRPFAQRAAL